MQKVESKRARAHTHTHINKHTHKIKFCKKEFQGYKKGVRHLLNSKNQKNMKPEFLNFEIKKYKTF